MLTYTCKECGEEFLSERTATSKFPPVFCGRICMGKNYTRERAGKPQPSVEKYRDVEAHFWTLVEKTDGCWLWKGDVTNKGYGRFRVPLSYSKRKAHHAHRFAYEISKGPIPPGLLLRHTCDTPLCVNPDHLIPGTHADNMRDMLAKGRAAFQKDPEAYRERLRQAQAERVKHKPETYTKHEAHLKVKDDTVRAIREAYQRGEGSTRALGKRFGVSGNYVHSLVSGRYRKDVKR